MKKIKKIEEFYKDQNSFGRPCHEILEADSYKGIFAIDFINKRFVDLSEEAIVDIGYYFNTNETPIYIVKYEDEDCF